MIKHSLLLNREPFTELWQKRGKKKKKTLFVPAAFLLTVSLLCSCSAAITDSTNSENSTEAAESISTAEATATEAPTTEIPDTEPEPEEVLSTDHVDIKNIVIDKSYKDEDGRPLLLLYLLYKVKTDDVNLKLTSVGITMTINDTNTYSSEYLPFCKQDTTKYMPDYTYTSVLTDVYVGESLNMIATFRIPRGDLAAGRTVVLSDNDLPDMKNIRFMTDLIEECDTGTDIARKYDKKGYNQAMDLRSRDKLREWAIESKDWYFGVEDMLELVFTRNPYQDWCYVNNLTYTVDFWRDDSYYDAGKDDGTMEGWYEAWKNCNRFSVSSSLGTRSEGWFYFTPGFIICTYDPSGPVIEIPWTLDEEKLAADPDRYWEYKELNEDGTGGFTYRYYDTCLELISLDLVHAFSVYE